MSEATLKKIVMPEKKLSPAERHVRSLGGDFLMVSEVADVIGVSTSTIRKLIANPEINAPSFFVKFGDKAQIYLFTQQDVEELRDYFDNFRRVRPTGQNKGEKRIGRPPKYTEEERKAKRAEYNRMYYERRKAERRAKENDEVRSESAGRGGEQALYPEFKEG